MEGQCALIDGRTLGHLKQDHCLPASVAFELVPHLAAEIEKVLCPLQWFLLETKSQIYFEIALSLLVFLSNGQSLSDKSEMKGWGYSPEQ